jgi:cobalt-zinc-cadmium resistance protein CzcA
MLNKIIGFSIHNKLIVGLSIFVLIAFGTYNLTKLPIDAVPDITNNQVQVVTVSPALGTTDIERLVTFPIEQVTGNIPGLIETRSFSRFGLSVVTLVFDDNVDVYWARQQLSERLSQIQDQFPKGFGTPTLGAVSTGLGEIFQYTVRAEKGFEKNYSEMELRTIQDWIVRRQLLSVPGVADVNSFGGLLKQYEISIDPEKLIANNLSLNDVFTALENNNQNTGGSYIEKGPTSLFIRTEGLATSIKDIESIVVKNNTDSPLFIRDFAIVRYGNATPYGALTFNGSQQVSGAIVLMLKGANSKEVVNSVKARIAEIQKTLPKGVVIDAFLDRTKMVDKAIHTVSQNLIEGALIVIFILVLFLGNFRAGLIVASVIPLSMLFAIILMNAFGVSGNLMSLGALDFGLIVDGAVIVVEAVLHAIHSKKSIPLQNINQTVKSAAGKMMNSAVFGQIIILMVYLPILTLEGIEGKMFKPMAQSVAFALLGAFLLSLTYVPMMSALFLQKEKNQPTFSDKMMTFLENKYRTALLFVLRIQKQVLGIVVLMFVLAVYLLSQLGGEFIPTLPEGDYAVETRVLTGSNIHTSIDAVSKASKILLSRFPEVKEVVGKTGTSEVPSEPNPVDLTDMIIVLKDKSEWTSATTYPELEKKMNEALAVIPGVSFSFQFPVAMRFNELISGARQDVVCKIYGENLDTLANYAQQIGGICNTIKGTEAVYVESVTGLPQIVVRYNRTALAQFKVSIADANRIVNTAFAGEVAGKIYEGEKRFDLVVRLSSSKRKSIEDVSNLMITTSNGTQIPLNTIADVNIEEGYNQIQRENTQRRIIVGFNVRDRDVESTVNELQQKIASTISLPTGYSIDYGGAFKNLEEAKTRLSIAVPVSLIIIFTLLYFAFRSMKQGLIIFTSIPLSAIGGVLALYIRDIPFSISAGIGFIALFGVAVLNGIVLISEFNNLKKTTYSNNIRIIIDGSTTRLRPVLMTALVASLGFLPMALSTGEGAEVQRPLATVVIGGLLLATFLTLFILPMVYLNLEKRKPKSDPIITPMLIFILVSTSFSSFGQQPISLQSAIDSAKANNYSLKNSRLVAEYQKTLIGSAAQVPQAILSGEIGQFNSFYIDKRIGISQTFSFPTIYKNQRDVLKESWAIAVTRIGINELDLSKQVSLVYNQLIYLNAKKQLLKQNDSLLVRLATLAKTRLDNGESNLLEQSATENLKQQFTIQLQQVETNLTNTQLQFSLLLNSDINYIPIDTTISLSVKVADTSDFSKHPVFLELEHRKTLSKLNTKLERSKFAPDLLVAYNIMSMKGTGSDNISYDRNLRFQSAQIGVGIPIFSHNQKAQINASRINELIVENEYVTKIKMWQNNYNQALQKYNQLESSIHAYQSSIIQNTNQIRLLANHQYEQGEINFGEWYFITFQTMNTMNDYLELINERNKTAIELNYITIN